MGPRVRATPLEPEYQAKLRSAIREHGTQAIAKLVGLTPPTISGLAAGTGCQESSKNLARLYIAGTFGAAIP